MRLTFDPNSTADYQRFLRVKGLPQYRIVGREAWFPDEYAAILGGYATDGSSLDYSPLSGLFDYQRDISALSLKKKRFAVFADCGLGKTLILLEWARTVVKQTGGGLLIISPLMVIEQTLAECKRFYGDRLHIDRVPAKSLANWCQNPTAIGITNYDALKDEIPQGRLKALALDESSMLKSHYGKWGQECLRLGAGLEWKLCLTGTPAPNDRIEYANHAVFLGAFPTVNSFLARFFVNRGQTNERWELKPHALRPFYRALSHWCIFLTNPATYGWKDNTRQLPPIEVSVEDVALTKDQTKRVRAHTGELIVSGAGGIGSRAKLARIAKTGDSLKPAYIRKRIESWPKESTIVWCRYNDEQDAMERVLPEAASLRGDTSFQDRSQAIEDFKAGRRKVIISKPKIMGFGLNLQVATRQVFSTLQDSYEEYYQCVKRSNRVGSTLPLRVHIPVTEAERPMIETVLRKADRVHADTEEQERIFKEYGLCLS